MDAPDPATRVRCLQRWKRMKGRLRLPLSNISFPRPWRRRKSDSVYSTMDDPFARGPIVFLPRCLTGSAPTLIEIAHSNEEKPLPSLPSPTPTEDISFPTTSSEAQPERASRISSCSNRTYYTCWEGESTHDDVEPPPLPLRRRPRMPIRTLEYLLETTDDEDDTPQPPGAFPSTATFFGQTAARDIKPLSPDAAQAASDRRSATSTSLRRASSSPILPPSKLHSSTKGVVRVSDSESSKVSRLPTYESSRVPSYRT